jgi:hypothetical protein
MKLITKENYERLNGAYRRIMCIYDFACAFDDDRAWQNAYEAIFEFGYSRIVHECVPSFEWCDPDASYQDDVSAFVWALEHLMNNVKVI